MPGVRLQSFRRGDVAEAFAGALLRRIAFVSPVPREEDVGLDFFCAVSEREGKLAKAGPTFVVQVKANDAPIVYSKRHEIEWIMNQENPLFVLVVSTARDQIMVFSTWNMLNAFLLKSGKPIRLIPRRPPDGKPSIQRVGKTPRLDIYLGEPILQFSSADLMNEQKASDYAAILKEWILLDRENIVRRASKMYWVIGPTHYITNHSLRDCDREVHFYYNAKNLKDCQLNFVQSAIALKCVLSKYIDPPPGWRLFQSDMLKFLQRHESFLRPCASLLKVFGCTKA